ncbi:MAG: hypothetical protein QN716_12130 [Nitrososphaeraceae archaeon]|nr:hypothetical protein [Nitrososphaeraceae archaeon]
MALRYNYFDKKVHELEETEQSIKQKNSGSDGSTNVNCADNDIGGATEVPEDAVFPPIDAQVCGTAAVDLGTD